MDPEEDSSSSKADWDAFQQDLANTIVTDLVKLRKLWIKIGIGGQSLQDRYSQVLEHYQNLSRQMYEEDSILYERIVETIERNIETLKEHCEQLGLTVPEIEHGTPLAMKKQLSAKLEEVELLREARLSRLEDLRMKEGDLLEILSMEPYDFGHENRLPTEEEMKELAQHIDMLIVEKTERYRKYCIYRTDILRLMKVLQREPTTGLEQDLVSEPADCNSVKLSQHKLALMKNLTEELKQEKESASKLLEDLKGKLLNLWGFLKEDDQHCQAFLKKNGHCGWQGLNAIRQEINRCQELRRANLGHFVQELRKDLADLWFKCRASEEQKHAFRVHFTNDDFTEELLKIHEEEVFIWRNTYQTFKDLFINAEKIGDLYQKVLDMQQRMTDPNRFYNRGGQLLQEERERKKLISTIPKMEKDLLELSKQYEDRVGVPFKIDGMSLSEYLQANRELLLQEKENEKMQRKQRKELGNQTPSKQHQKSVQHTPGLSTVGGGMKSMTFKSPARLAINTPSRQILRTPNGQQQSAGKPNTARKLVWQGNQTPSTPKTRGPTTMTSNSNSNISYAAFEKSLNNPIREENKRSTMNNQKVLASKRTPLFTDSGARRKRFSNGRSPRLSRNVSRILSPHASKLPPLSGSARGRALKLATTAIPFLY